MCRQLRREGGVRNLIRVRVEDVLRVGRAHASRCIRRHLRGETSQEETETLPDDELWE